MPEQTYAKAAYTTVVAPSGFGYGEGSISIESQIIAGKLSAESLGVAVHVVLNDPSIFTAVDLEADDDGCGDGRGTMRIYKYLDPVSKQPLTFHRSLRRAKLFGGGLISSASMWRAVDGIPTGWQTLAGDRRFMMRELLTRGRHYGAHTDDRAVGQNCGCGAIDNYEAISRNIVKYEPEIMKSLRVLYGAEYDESLSAILRVFDLYKQLKSEYFAGVTGRSTMDEIEHDGAVIKQVFGDHMEAMVAINTIKDTTLDQDRLREKLIERGLSPNIQAFVIDEWRGREYADIVADIARKQGKNRDAAYGIAYADFLIRTLAVSATLTKGNQPVLLRQAD